MEKYFIIPSVFILIFAILTYPKWSYKKWAEHCEKNVIPFTGKYKNE